jgi:ABC-type phosphate/phosphonate transport system substrate-binding protein
MSENDEDEKKDKGITLKWFVENKAKEGNELILKEDYDYFIFSDYNSVGIVETESMIEYLECENKENFVFSINKETREINIHFL